MHIHISHFRNFWETDTTLYSSIIGTINRKSTSKLREIFSKLVEQIESLYTMKNDFLSRLYKDIHWLILIMNDIICSNTVSQLSLIPDEIIKYDIEQVCK